LARVDDRVACQSGPDAPAPTSRARYE
jgi:hypothetical protein